MVCRIWKGWGEMAGGTAGTSLPSFFTDLCHPGLGPWKAPALLPSNEHCHVGASPYLATGGPAPGLWLYRDPLCDQEAGVWRPRWASGQAYSLSSWPMIRSGLRSQPVVISGKTILLQAQLSHLEDGNHNSSPLGVVRIK